MLHTYLVGLWHASMSETWPSLQTEVICRQISADGEADPLADTCSEAARIEGECALGI